MNRKKIIASILVATMLIGVVGCKRRDSIKDTESTDNLSMSEATQTVVSMESGETTMATGAYYTEATEYAPTIGDYEEPTETTRRLGNTLTLYEALLSMECMGFSVEEEANVSDNHVSEHVAYYLEPGDYDFENECYTESAYSRCVVSITEFNSYEEAVDNYPLYTSEISNEMYERSIPHRESVEYEEHYWRCESAYGNGYFGVLVRDNIIIRISASAPYEEMALELMETLKEA